MRLLPLFLLVVLIGCTAREKERVSEVKEAGADAPEGMVWVEGDEFMMGSDDRDAYSHERPAHMVRVDGFWMDKTEVTNAQFAAFVEATRYVTVAERKPDWEELKKQLPSGTPKPPDSVLVPGSLTFFSPDKPVRLDNYAQWWRWTPEANWRQPEGRGSTIEARLDHPVVHIAYEDAIAYCQWADKRLPTEAEWELASREGQPARPFNFASDISSGESYNANVFQGSFPNNNLMADGFKRTAPVKSFPPNQYGLYDLIGNVWEWTSDFYHPDYYAELASKGVAVNPKGPARAFDPAEPGIVKYVTKGGSYLCATDYCSNYRPTARQATAFDSGQSHIGFRCVK
jgi:formylglycine-generating enzyme required for sulfatase activity